MIRAAFRRYRAARRECRVAELALAIENLLGPLLETSTAPALERTPRPRPALEFTADQATKARAWLRENYPDQFNIPTDPAPPPVPSPAMSNDSAPPRVERLSIRELDELDDRVPFGPLTVKQPEPEPSPPVPPLTAEDLLS